MMRVWVDGARTVKAVFGESAMKYDTLNRASLR